MAKPKWITIGTVEGSMNGSSEITAAAHTGRVARGGNITVTTAGGVTDTIAVSQVGAEEVITIETKEYSANAVGQNITIQGKSNSAKLLVNTSDKVIEGLTYKLAIAGVTDESWNGNSDISVDGDPGANAMYDFTITVNVPENKSESELVAEIFLSNAGTVMSGVLTITQAAGVKNYATPVISAFSYPIVSAAGDFGVAPSAFSYSQTWGWNESNSNGGTLNGTLESPIAGTTFNFTGSALDEDPSTTGTITFYDKGDTESDVTSVTITATVTVNGKTSTEKTAVAQQAANKASYGDVIFSSRVPSATDISASGGSVSSSNISWSGTGVIVTQKITYTSGTEYTINDTSGLGAFGAIELTYSDAITAASKGTAVSARTEAGVITIIAGGAGGQAATKEVTVYQAANIATYGEVTIGQATPVSLNAQGETYTIVPAMKQTVTYTSGATRTEATPADNKVQLSANYAVKTAKEGFSLETNTGKVTVSPNPTTAPRESFVVTISAEGEGGKTATKDITFNQQGSSSTLNLSPDTLSFSAAGETKTVTITSNDSWTVS